MIPQVRVFDGNGNLKRVIPAEVLTREHQVNYESVPLVVIQKKCMNR